MNEIEKKIRTLEYYSRLLNVIESFETDRESNENYYIGRLAEIVSELSAEGKDESELTQNWRYENAQEELTKAKEDKAIIATIRAAILKLAT